MNDDGATAQVPMEEGEQARRKRLIGFNEPFLGESMLY